jgi:carboxymethylenebutenolidase
MTENRRTIGPDGYDSGMCHDHDSRPPIAPIAGGALDSEAVTLTADDGNQFTAFRARAADSTGASVVILPDVRGLHPFYEDLAMRFAENGIDALAIDYFGRTAGPGRRGAGFEHGPHVDALTFAGLTADVTAAAAYQRAADATGSPRLYTVGFCMGGRLSFVCGTLGLGLAGVIGFYGSLTGAGRGGTPVPADVADRIACPVLGLFGGDDPGIPTTAIASFEAALRSANVDHRVLTFDGAPHSFFDRKADEYTRASEAAWAEVLSFVRGGSLT